MNAPEAAVLKALVDAGKHVYVPFNGSSRVDLVFIDDTGMYRVQCKTGRRMLDVIFFATCSNTAKKPLDYRGQVDHFGVAYEHAVYLVPVDDNPVRGAHLRLAPTRNGQAKGGSVGGGPPSRTCGSETGAGVA